MEACQLLFTFAVIVTAAHCITCPSEWTVFGTSCYALGAEDLTWSDAEEMCMVFGSTLVEIDDSQEDDFVGRMINDHNIPDVNVWIGATDVFNEGHFEWSGSKTRISYSNWVHGAPDGASDLGVKEDCVAVRGSRHFKWNDLPCSNRAYFICEFRLDDEEGSEIVG